MKFCPLELCISCNSASRGLKITDGCGVVLFRTCAVGTTYRISVPRVERLFVTAFDLDSELAITNAYVNIPCYVSRICCAFSFLNTNMVRVFTLTDRNYRMPISRAMLHFFHQLDYF